MTSPSDELVLKLDAHYADSARALLWGTALGDAAGYPVELLSAQEISLRFQNQEGSLEDQLFTGARRVSDDTQLTLYTLDALLQVLEWTKAGSSCDELACLWLAYLRWFRAIGYQHPEQAPYQPDRPIDGFASLRQRRGPGKATLAALSTGQLLTPQREEHRQALGSGALVRSAVFALLPLDQLTALLSLTRRAAALTHGHPDALGSACAYVLLIRAALVYRGQPSPLLRALERVLAWMEPGQLLAQLCPPTTQRCLQQAYRLGRDDATSKSRVDRAFGKGWLAPEVLGISVLAGIRAEQQAGSGQPSLLAGIKAALMIDGDSDSVAAISAALLGAAYGSALFEPRLVESLDIYPVLDYMLGAWLEQLDLA